MSLLADIRYALRKARAERYIEEELDKYEDQLIRDIASRSPRPLSHPLHGYGRVPLNAKEAERLSKGYKELHEKYKGM